LWQRQEAEKESRLKKNAHQVLNDSICVRVRTYVFLKCECRPLRPRDGNGVFKNPASVNTGTADEQGDQQPPKLPLVQKHKPSSPAMILDDTADIDAELERPKMRMQTIADQLNEMRMQTIADNEIHSAQFPNAHPAHSNLPHTYIPHNDHPTPHAHSFDPPSHYVYPPNAYPPNAYPPNAYPPNAYPSHPYTPHAYSPYAFLPHAHPPIAYPPLAYAPHAYAPNANNAPHYRYHQLPPSTEISNYPYGYVDETRIRREERMNAILQLKEQEIKELRQKEYIRNG